ncbi:unnamed protein product [Caenorhabditis angaria]|uniref:Choline/carnitine acyltransferase domain-containing protein n=1 Tax=Caenorhabditis angaria TaxID=860376 RepID=A0A9P1N6S6_9PELO|nr:unnamed protein product [Caenorhabditis angaria]
MSTFSRQEQLPSLPVPPLRQSLESYVKSASALLSPEEVVKLREDVLKFENSSLADILQKALENRAKSHRNWLEDWWYNVYTEDRHALIPFVSFGALNTSYTPIDGGQISRAADVLHHWIAVWDRIRK